MRTTENEKTATPAGSQPRRAVRREGRRSRTGCFECRRRKTKCDEVSPTCGQCRKADRQCSIVDALFRPHPFSITVARPGESHTSTRDGGFARRTPGHLVSASPTSAIQETGGGKLQAGCSNIEGAQPGFSSCLGQDVEETLLHRVLPENNNGGRLFDGANGSDHSTFDHQQALSLTSASFPQSETNVHSPADMAEMLLFTRCFAEKLAKGMDLFSQRFYFRRRILLLARTRHLARYGIMAAAAKQLGHVKRPLSLAVGTKSQHRILSCTKANGSVDYLWYGAKYYGQAIQAMAADILGQTNDSWGSSFAPPLSASAPSCPTTTGLDTTEVKLAAALTMCMYEQLSASSKAWSRHLDGIYKLLRLDKCEAAFRSGTGSASWPAPTLESRSILQDLFWCFVRNDFEESFATSRPTRIDTENTALWHSMGAFDEGNGGPTSPERTASNIADHDTMGIVALRSLLRLMCRVADHTATKVRSEASPDAARTLTPGSITSRDDTWTTLADSLHRWRSSLPSGFEPDIVRPRDRKPGDQASDMFATETWYSCTVCALAMMYYHMTCLILLLRTRQDLLLFDANNTPHSQDRLEKRLRAHARDLISITLGEPGDELKMHTLQPLYVAGRCLTHEADQKFLIDMLKDVERSLGIATTFRVKDLIKEWGADSLQGLSELDAELSDLSSSDN